VSSTKLTVTLDERKIDALFAELNKTHLPGAAVGIAIDGTPVYRKGFGVASMELPVLLSPSMRMRIFSASKHFTCLAYMLMCEDGKADIDSRLGELLPELHPVTHKITMRQLMGHMSGLRDVCDVRWQINGIALPVSSPEVLSLYRDIDDVNFRPGTDYCYNNGAFLLLSTVIETISGQSLEEVLRTRIFEPVGMHDTLLRRFDDDFVPNSATLHSLGANGVFSKTYLAGALAGEGGIVSTVNDMLRWLAHMDEPRVGSASTWALLKTPQVLANGTSTGYGLGLKTERYRGVDTLYHAGGALGGNSQMLKAPAAGLDVAIMLNRADVMGMQLAHMILDTCLPELEPVAEASKYPLASGVFRSPVTGRVVQLSARNGQQVVSIDAQDFPFIADSDGLLRTSGIMSFDQLSVRPLGDPENPTAIQFNRFGNHDDLIRVEPPKRPDTTTLCGDWISIATGSRATFFDTTEDRWLRTTGRWFGSLEFKLERLGDYLWRAKAVVPGLGGILSFEESGNAFMFSTYRNWMLKFRRIA
jgi:D-aminopeptidase